MLFTEHAVRVLVPGLVQAATGGGLTPLPHRHPQLCHSQQVHVSAHALVQAAAGGGLTPRLIAILNYAIVSR
jgi:hypothetical protein